METRQAHLYHPYANPQRMEGNPGTETSKYGEKERKLDSASSGERTRKSLNRNTCIPGFLTAFKILRKLTERFWESRPQRVKAPYVKADETEQDPEYHETRETLWEVRGTTP